MRPGARMSAAMEVIAAMDREHRPASIVLGDWGRTHRFAGSGDRSAIGTLVYDALRRRRSLAAQMGVDTPRALVLAAAVRAFDMTVEAVAAACNGDPHAPAALTADELACLVRGVPESSPVDVLADIPEWLVPSLTRAFGDDLLAQGQAMAERAPIDLRVNTLRADREKVLGALSRFEPVPTPFSPVGVRVPVPLGSARAPNVEADGAHGRGWFEVQDEGSQIAAALAGAAPRRQVLDLCAGAGGKSLAMSAAMDNTGQIYAYDSDRQQLRPIFERLRRADARNVQVLDGGDKEALTALGDRFDTVLVDAPCTGSGTWRRRPDTKWRLKPDALAKRCKDQDTVLAMGSAMVKPGGRLVYVTCSILPEENWDRVSEFLASHDDFAVEPISEVWTRTMPGEKPASADGRSDTLQLTPANHGTDGFFIAVLVKSGNAAT